MLTDPSANVTGPTLRKAVVRESLLWISSGSGLILERLDARSFFSQPSIDKRFIPKFAAESARRAKNAAENRATHD